MHSLHINLIPHEMAQAYVNRKCFIHLMSRRFALLRALSAFLSFSRSHSHQLITPHSHSSIPLALIHTHSHRCIYPPTSPFSMSILSTAKSVLFAPFQYCIRVCVLQRVPFSTYNISLYKENITFIYWISHQWTFFIFNAFSCYSWNFFYFWHESPGEITFDEHMYTFFEYIKIIWILCQSE